jgi:hypothetical protein
MWRIYNEVYRITQAVQFSSSVSQFSVGDSHGKFVVEEVLEVDL